MKEAAERYSPEMAEAFQPTETERPATKKSCAVLDLRAAQKPIHSVARTVARLKARIHGSRYMASKTGKPENVTRYRGAFLRIHCSGWFPMLVSLPRMRLYVR